MRNVERIVTYGGRARSASMLDDGTRDRRARDRHRNAHPRTTFLDLLDVGTLDAAVRRARCCDWKTNGPSLKLNLALGELPEFHAPSRARIRSRITARRSTSRRRSTICRRRYDDARARRRERRAADRVFHADADRSVAGAAGQTHPLDLRAVFSVRPRPTVGANAKREAAADRIVAILGALGAESAERDRSSVKCSRRPIWKTRFGLVGGHIFHGELLPGQIYEDRFATRTPVTQPVSVRFGRAPGRLRERLSRQASGVRDSKKIWPPSGRSKPRAAKGGRMRNEFISRRRRADTSSTRPFASIRCSAELARRNRDDAGCRHADRLRPGPIHGVAARAIGAKRYLEIGVFTGYSSLAMALALPDDGRVVACDVSEEYTSVARRYWQKAGVEKKMDLRLGPAVATLDKMIADKVEPFDMAFIDADKANYDAYYERCLQARADRRPDPFDNMLWSGRVTDKNEHDEDTDALRALNAKAGKDERVDVALLSVGDGILIARKR